MGTHPETIVKAPFKIPEPPIPAMARPTINIFDEVEIAHIREPSSNTKKNPTKVHYRKGWVSREKRYNGEKKMERVTFVLKFI